MGLTILAARAENLPDIEAHQFKIVPLEKSRTGRVYRFKTEASQLPKTGNILLIEENDKPTMAFRVLKTDFDHSEFIAKRVRRYDQTSELKLNDRYTTVEKLADLVTPPPSERDIFDPSAKPLLDPNPSKNLVGAGSTPTMVPQLDPTSGATPPADNTQLPTQAVVSNPTNPPAKAMDVEKFDDDLDSSTSPTNLKNAGGTTVDDATAGTGVDRQPIKTHPADDDGYDLEVKERNVFNPYKYMAGFELSSMKNMSNFQIFGGNSYGAFGFFFSDVIRRNLFFKKEAPQDSLSIDYGLSYYSDDNVNGHNDDYEIIPLKIELRYDLHLNETFTPFVYFGLQYNWVLSAVNVNTSDPTDNTAYNNRHGFQPNIGVGMMYNIGPQWYLRVDLGLDRLAAGLAVRW